jgi:large subunit ribosomal protein L10
VIGISDMKKLGLIVKEVSENRIKNYLKESNSFFLIKYSGLSGPDLNALRLSLKKSSADFFVVKNSVARRAFKGSTFEGLVKSIDGPCGVVFTKNEPVGASKALYDFTKEHDKLKLEAGFLEDRLLETKDIEALAKLPSKEVLRAQLVMTLNQPITKLVVTLNRTLGKFVICLDKIKEKKAVEQGGKNG